MQSHTQYLSQYIQKNDENYKPKKYAQIQLIIKINQKQNMLKKQNHLKINILKY